MAETCPKCGAVRDPVSDKYPRPFEVFDCGSNVGSNFENRFWQSTTCRIWQLESRVAELTSGLQRIRGRFGPGVDAEIDNLLKGAT